MTIFIEQENTGQKFKSSFQIDKIINFVSSYIEFSLDKQYC